VACGAPQRKRDGLATVSMQVLDRAAAVVEPSVAPLHQRD
jgi:hypothetical protein